MILYLLHRKAGGPKIKQVYNCTSYRIALNKDKNWRAAVRQHSWDWKDRQRTVTFIPDFKQGGCVHKYMHHAQILQF